jgi:hypothetical protein
MGRRQKAEGRKTMDCEFAVPKKVLTGFYRENEPAGKQT